MLHKEIDITWFMSANDLQKFEKINHIVHVLHKYMVTIEKYEQRYRKKCFWMLNQFGQEYMITYLWGCLCFNILFNQIYRAHGKKSLSN